MSFGKTITLSSGAKIPQVGLGTWLSKPKEVEHAVEFAIRNGYRHIDCALIYQNQHEVGAALKKVIPSVVKREELFITSKLWNHNHAPENVEKELDETLAQLELDYVDLYLIHWPCCFPAGKALLPPHPTKPEIAVDGDGPTLVETWKAMIALLKTGKVKSIGVSNFTVDQIKGIAEATGVWPAVNQVERHPLNPQPELLAFCKAHNVHITAYSPLGNNVINKQRVVDYDAVKNIAGELGATNGQVLIAWGTYEGCSVIPKSVQEDRIISNFKQVELSKAQFDAVSAIGSEGNRIRFNVPFRYCTEADPKWDVNIFSEPDEVHATHQVKIQ